MDNTGWHGESIRHSLARKGVRGLKKKPLSEIYDVSGLDRLVGNYVAELGMPHNKEEVASHAVEFRDWEIVIDSSGAIEKYLGNLTKEQERRAKARAPCFILGFTGTEDAYVFVGKGGNFVHPPLRAGGRAYRDNHYMEPAAYLGPSIVPSNQVTLYARIMESDTGKSDKVPFNIRGLVGLETKINYTSAKMPKRQLAGVA